MQKTQEPPKIVGQGTLAGSGLPFVLVTSSSEPGRAHIVSYAYEGAYIGSRMHCDCTGFTYRGHCRHAQLVSDWLAAGLAALGLPYPPQAPETPAPEAEADSTSETAGADVVTSPAVPAARARRWGSRSQAAFSLMR